MKNQLPLNLHENLRNIDEAPAFDRSCVPFCDQNRGRHPLAKKLLFEPHFKIGDVIFCEQKVREEIDSIDGEWAGYENDVLQKRGAGKSNYWSAKFLRNFTTDPDYGFGETIDYLEKMNKLDQLESGRCRPEFLMKTTLWDKTPEINSVLNQLVTLEMCDRILISKVDGGQRVNWHSHCAYESTYSHAYIHVPLVTNPQTEMLVFMNNKYHVQHYGLKTAWIINTQHNHAVNNPSPGARYHLLILASMEDPKLNEVLRHT